MSEQNKAIYHFEYHGLTGNELHLVGKTLEKYGFSDMATRTNRKNKDLFDIFFETTEYTAEAMQLDLLEQGLFIGMMWDE